jgi:hypothetical protein
MTVDSIVRIAATGMIIAGACTVVALQMQKAPYGKHRAADTQGAVGFDPRLAWFVQECPSLLMALGVACTGDKFSSPGNTTLMFMFLAHYMNRCVAYPLQMRSGNPVPVSIMCAAFGFTLVNGTLQSLALGHVYDYGADWHKSPRFLVGAAMFVLGFAINAHSDATLRALRKPGDRTYSIPVGGMFQYVSCANYFGEIIEWIGFAIAAWSLPSAAFAFFTVCNIGPRALHHHEWYKTTFPDTYPADRKALIPFLL